MRKGGFPLSRSFTCVDKIEAMYERLLVTFTFTSDLPYVASILLTRLKATCIFM